MERGSPADCFELQTFVALCRFSSGRVKTAMFIDLDVHQVDHQRQPPPLTHLLQTTGGTRCSPKGVMKEVDCLLCSGNMSSYVWYPQGNGVCRDKQYFQVSRPSPAA